MMDTLDNSTTERADAARNRARLLEAAARLVAERGAEHVTMHEVAETAGVGKGTLFRRFGDRDGLLLALLGEAEAEFQEAYTEGLPPLGPGAPARDRLVAFGCALIERIAADADLGAALGRQVLHERRHASDTGRAFHRHVRIGAAPASAKRYETRRSCRALRPVPSCLKSVAVSVRVRKSKLLWYQ